MKQAGHSLSSIAVELGLEGGGPAVNRLLEEQFKQDAAYLTSERRAVLLALEWERLESIIRANYTSAMMGDPTSTRMMLDAIKVQVQIGQLATPDSNADQTRVLVVGGHETEYVEKLKTMAGDE